MGLFSFLFSKLKKPSAVSHPPRTSPFAADPTETVPDATMMVPRIPQDEPESEPVSAAPSDPSDELMDAIATAVMEKAAAPLDPPAPIDSQPQAWTPETDSTPADQPTERISPAELAALMDKEPEIEEIPEPKVVPVVEPVIEETPEPEIVPVDEPEIEESPEPEIVPVEEPEIEEIPEPEIVPVEEPEIEEIPEPEIVPVEEPEIEEIPEPEIVPVEEPVVEEIPEPEIVPDEEPVIEETPEPEIVPVEEPEIEETPEPEMIPVVEAEPVPDVTEPIPAIPAEQWGSSLPENFVPQNLRRSLLPQFDDEKLRLVWKLKGTGKKRRQRVICECVKDQPVFIICDSNGSNCTVITEEGEEIGRLSERDSTVYHEVVAGNPHNLYIKKIRMNDYNKPTVKILVIVRERRAAE